MDDGIVALGISAFEKSTMIVTIAYYTSLYHVDYRIMSNVPGGRIERKRALDSGSYKLPATRFLQLTLHKGIKKPESSLIAQLRTGKIGLRAFLNGRQLVNNSRYECGHKFQTLRHVLLKCRKFTRLRRETWRDEQRKESFRVVAWTKMFTHLAYAKKAADSFLKFQGMAVAQSWQTALRSEGL